MNTSLTNLDFGDKQISIYGTQNDPMIKCSDLLIHVLGYKQCNDARWYRQWLDNPKLVIRAECPGDRFFTEMGIYKALMKSNKPIAEQFQEKVCDLLKQMRIQTLQQLEATQKQLEESKQSATDLLNKQPASIYTIKRNNQIIYVGQDQSINQSRISTHLNERQKIISQYQYIDIVLATMNYEDIQIEQQPCLKSETTNLETILIQELNPLCNQMMNQICINKCNKCNKEYKSRGWLQRHEIKGCL